MPYVTAGLKTTMAAHAWIKRDRRTSNKERDREIRTITKNRRIKRRMRRRRTM